MYKVVMEILRPVRKAGRASFEVKQEQREEWFHAIGVSYYCSIS